MMNPKFQNPGDQALRRGEERFCNAFDNMLEGTQILDFEWRYLYLNAAAETHNRRPNHELLGNRYMDMWPCIEASHVFAMIKRCMDERVPCRMQNEFIFPDGVVRWFELSIQPIPEGTFILSTDITERKLAQQELLELNRTLEERIGERTAEVQDLYDNAPAGYHSLNADGNLIRINQTELSWFGYTRAEVLGRPFLEFMTPASQAVFRATFPIFLQTGSVRDLEFDLTRKDGTIFSVLVNATAIYDADGVYLQSRSTVFDNSARKHAEDALRCANAEMERAVRLKDEFLANMSHELRTPLTGILALGENLQEQIYGPLSERQLKVLRNIEISSRHLLALINDLLDLSKIEAGRLELELQPVIVNDICQTSLMFVKEMAHKKSIQLSYHNDEQQSVIIADSRRLKQMLVNLLGNAVKFTPEGGRVELSVTLNPHDRQLQFAVQDTGMGIAVEDQARLFQPFLQLDAALARHYEGTGLGLALVKRLALQHGGSVHVASAGIPGQGSCFTVCLPCCDQKPEMG